MINTTNSPACQAHMFEHIVPTRWCDLSRLLNLWRGDYCWEELGDRDQTLRLLDRNSPSPRTLCFWSTEMETCPATSSHDPDHCHIPLTMKLKGCETGPSSLKLLLVIRLVTSTWQVMKTRDLLDPTFSVKEGHRDMRNSWRASGRVTVSQKIHGYICENYQVTAMFSTENST